MILENPVISNTSYTLGETFSILNSFPLLASLSIVRRPLDAIYSSLPASMTILPCGLFLHMSVISASNLMEDSVSSLPSNDT